jgi:hypothetical protein
MLGYVVIAVTCRRPPPRRYTHDDGGGGLAGLNARKRKTVCHELSASVSCENSRAENAFIAFI